MKITILAIESSCDDTSIAILRDNILLCNLTANQTIHKEYGGVVPEVASRKHLIHIVPLLDRALKEAQVDKSEISAIAFTKGPGLLGSLIVGVNFAKSLALSLSIPLIEVHHMKAHILAHFIEDPMPRFPFLCLTVSGGHTQLVVVEGYDDMEVIGETIDDAAGEAFDKAGKMMGLDYPAGPLIDRLAKNGNAVFSFPEPKVPGLNFSFSGLKTAILYFLQKEMKKDATFIKNNLNDLCQSIQSRIVSILLKKLIQASKQTGIKEIAIAGGVSANSGLRTALIEEAKEQGWEVYIPHISHCTDNAAMIAQAAHFKYLKKEFSSLDVTPAARMEF